MLDPNQRIKEKDFRKSMKRFTHTRTMLIIFGIIFLMLPQTAYSYLDPGTGSYVLQVLLAAFVGAAFTVKIYWAKIKMVFVNLFSKTGEIKKNQDNEV